MIGDVLLIEQKHERVARELAAKINKRQFERIAVAIGGESGSGKSEIAETLRTVLDTEGYRVKILHLDNYYKVPPAQRNDYRREHGMSAVGLHEINWEILEENVVAFRKGKPTTIPFIDLYTDQEDKLITDFKDIDVLLIEGLYACNAPADVNVLIDLTYHETKKAQIKRKKEKVDELRFKVLEKEHQEVVKLRPRTDYFVAPNFTLIDNTDKYTPLEDENAGRLVLCSNTLPVCAEKTADGYELTDNIGGVSSALSSIYGGYDSVWFGRCCLSGDWSSSAKSSLRKHLSAERGWHPLYFSDPGLIEGADAFCHRCIWPLFHYFTESCEFSDDWWQAYQTFNKKFYQMIKPSLKPNDTVWIHDYHLMLLPQMVRQDFPDITIGFFLHTPFPSFELFRILPWRAELLRGVLGADLVGFHIYEYTRHFQSSVFRILGYESKMGNIMVDDHLVHTDSFSLGVDFAKFAVMRKSDDVKKRIDRIATKMKDRKVVLSIDRLDYSRGIENKLDVIDNFFSTKPSHIGHVVFYIRLFTSGGDTQHATAYKKKITRQVRACNDKHKTKDWKPIEMHHDTVPQEEIIALYNSADVLLVSSMRDGMNLISKEYFAARGSNAGVVVLSEFMGGTRELSEAILFNPNDRDGFLQALHKAVTMPEKKKSDSFKKMLARLQRNTAMSWSVDFMEGLKQVKTKQAEIKSRKFTEKIRTQMLADYHTASKRLFILDYNGTLVPLPASGKSRPPGKHIIDVLSILADNKYNTVVIITDNKRELLQKWFAKIGVDLIACSDAAIRRNGRWHVMQELTTEWKEGARPILEKYVVRTPGSYIDEKNYSLIWHFENAVKELGEVRSRELIDDLKSFSATEDFQLREGERLIEIKNAEAYKGKMLHNYLNEEDWEFILAVGDDWSNEYMFQHLPEQAYTLRVGSSTTSAKYSTRKQADVPELLRAVANINGGS